MRRLLALLLLVATPAWAACPTTDAYSTAVCTDGPCHYYRMDALAGTTENDVSSAVSSPCGESARNGTYVNTPTLNQAGALTTAGITDPSVLFIKASTTHMDIGGGAGSFNPLGGSGQGWTAEYWMKLTSLPAAQMVAIASGQDTTVYAWRSGTLNGTPTQFIFLVHGGTCNGGTSYAQINTGTVASGTWYYIVNTTVGLTASTLTSAELWVNASSIGSQSSFSGAFCSSVVNPTLGARQDFSFPIDGNIDEAAVYNVKLSSARISAHYNAGVTAPASSSRWPFTVKRPELPKFKNDDYSAQMVARGYNTGHFTAREIIPQYLLVGYVPFSKVPWGNVGH